MIITILSREEAEGISAHVILPHAIISIGEPEPRREGSPDQAKFADNDLRLGLLRLKFYDIDMLSITNAGYKHEIQESGGKGLFTDEQAVQVVDFVDGMKGKIEVLICHCEAGISRSSGMAAAINLVVNGSDEEIFKNIKYLPNMFVYRKVLNAFMGDK
jgi:hypothetical protein